jgi:hypothetical protein
MQGNDKQIKKDKHEEWRYRLSMDPQLTVWTPKDTGLRRFLKRYGDWYEKQREGHGAPVRVRTGTT